MARTLNHQTKNWANKRKIFIQQCMQQPRTIKPQTTLNHQPQTTNIPLDATSIWFTFQAMQEVMRPVKKGLWQQFTSSQKLRGKQAPVLVSETDGPLGLTPKNVVAVWVGNTDGEGPGLVGVQTAAPILFDIFVCCLIPTGLKNLNTIMHMCRFAGKVATVPILIDCRMWIHFSCRPMR